MSRSAPRDVSGERESREREPLVLVGLPGTGKSTVAPLIAGTLGHESTERDGTDGWTALDLDSEVERRAGATVPQLFASRGEAGFRALEISALKELADRPRTVIAAGGGVVTTSEARRELARCTVIWLRARIDTLVERLSTAPDPGATRPLLAGDGPAALRTQLAELIRERSVLYEQVADVVVDVDDRQPDEVTRAILGALGEDRTA